MLTLASGSVPRRHDDEGLGAGDDACAADRVHHSLEVVDVADAEAHEGVRVPGAPPPTRAFFELEAPILRVTGYDTPYPASRLEEDWLPNVDRILNACDLSFSY